MSANELRSEIEQHGSSLGSRLTKKLSKRLSMSGSSKDGGKDVAHTSPSSGYDKDTTSGRQSMPDTQRIGDQTAKDSPNAASSSAAKQEIPQIVVGDRDTAEGPRGETATADNVNLMSARELGTQAGERRSSITPGPLEYNTDIRRGPITTGVQRDSSEAVHGAGSSDQAQSFARQTESPLASDPAQQSMGKSPTGVEPAAATSRKVESKPGFAAFGSGPLGDILHRSSEQSNSKMVTTDDERNAQVKQPTNLEQNQGFGRGAATGLGIGAGAGTALGGPRMSRGMDSAGTDTNGMGTTSMGTTDKGTSGMNTSGMNTSGMNTSGMNTSGVNTSGMGNTDRITDTQASMAKSRDGGVVRGGNAVMGGIGESPKMVGPGKENSSSQGGSLAPGLAGAAGLAGAVGATELGAKTVMSGQRGATEGSRAPFTDADGLGSPGGAQKTTSSLPEYAPVAAAGGAGIVGMNSPARMDEKTTISTEPGMPGATRGSPMPADVAAGRTEGIAPISSTGRSRLYMHTMPQRSGIPSQPAPPGTGVMNVPDSSNLKDSNKATARRQYSTTPSSATTNTGAASTRAVRGLSVSALKTTALQDKLHAVSQKCKAQLGTTASELSQRSPTVDNFFDAVADERLRWMPRDGSRLDCSLRWASRLASAVDALRQSTESFTPGAEAAAQLIWGFMIMLLESDLDDTDLFESIFGRYGRVAVGIYLLIQYESVYKNAAELQPQATAVFADLLEMVCNTTTSAVEGSKAKEPSYLIEHDVDSAFITYAKRYSTHWNAVVEQSAYRVVKQSSLINSKPELGSLRQFLGVQDRPLQLILDSRMHSLAEGSFEWFNSTLYDFTIGQTPAMIMTGDAGSGKSALAQWTVERLQESAEHDSWNVIPYTIRADIPVATLTLRLLKGILHQMLDHCVSDRQLQEAILVHVANAAQGAMDGASETEVEEHLWKGIHAGLGSTIKFMFIVDGLDQIRAGDADPSEVVNKFTQILTKQNAGSKMIVFTRPLTFKSRSAGVTQFTMEKSQTRQDLVAFVTKVFQNSHLKTSKSDQLQSAVAAVVNRSQGSFSWAEMAVEYAKRQRTLAEATTSVQSLPQPMTELLDFHMKNLDLSQREAVAVISWLAASERPLLVEEIEELLRVNTTGPSLASGLSHDDHQWSSALKPLVVTRFGVVSFAHTSIRDHVLMKAKSANFKTPFNLKEANLDLLMRCLGWVQLQVHEETDVSMDKLTMDERHRLFDKYVILEYTARYWLSHLLSSNLVTDEGEFIFTSSFKKLLPTTVLFARLELTCKESQFTRSSVVDLYRIATDIRRLVLGEKSLGLLESVLLSARVAKFAHASYADEHCYEAWKLSQELLGQADPITLNCTEMMTQSFREQGTMTPQQEDIMKYLILTDSEITGVEFDSRLKYLGILVGMYKARGDNDAAMMVSKQFFNSVVEKYGTNSRQSTEAADFLTGQFSTNGSDEMSRDIARTKYDNITRTMGVTDERRIKYSLYMAQLYEQQGQHAQAHTVLSSLWAGLNARDIDSVDMMDKKANVALVYYQFLRRQGRNDEAEVIMHELVADLETSGIQSPEMMQRVQLLRAETREMQMYDLDRSLCILLWQYYKQNHKEHTPEARSLALSLAEDMAKPVSTKDSKSVSGHDRKLMVELLDSIASSPSNISVPTLILCHNLASIYVRDEDWTGASECSKAVLRHVHPTVEQAGSYKKFTTELAPPITDLSLILAYCHFRKLHLEQASIVYDNAFSSLVASDKVPVSSVLAVAKAVVEFYETTFQFTKALDVLHVVSNFLTSRLGEADKHTIDNMYLEAAMAKRLEMDKEAKTTYQRIYKNNLKGDIVAPAGMKAALALIDLYERDKQWDSALDIYRHVWPTIIVQDNMQPNDKTQTDVLLDKTYTGYMKLLTPYGKDSNFSERYRVSSDYVNTCRNVYGPTHQKTLDATLLFAELCESHDSYTDQAIGLYRQPLQTSEWIPTSQATKSLDQMNQSLPITLKHKLAQLYVRKRDSTSEARSLYTEEFQLGKKTQGYFSPTTLAWLRELALAHSRQATPTSVQQGNALLHNYVMDCLQADGDTAMMASWARKIAAIYLECGFIEGGNNVLDELRQRVVSGPELSTIPLSDRKDAVFTAAFEEVFGRRASAGQIMQEMAAEMQTQQAFNKSLSSHEFLPTLITGDNLARLQTEQSRTRAATATRNKLYEYFCATLSATPLADRDVVKQFYKICLKEVHHNNGKKNILVTTTKMVRDLCNSSRFQDASDVSGVLHSFLHLTDSLNTNDNIITASKLCLYLTGHQATKCESSALSAEMSAKSKMLLQELMASSKTTGMEIVDLPFHELNDFITLLGEHEMFDDLEGVLTQLWTSRIVQRTWTPDVVVWIGRRLVETRFCRGSVDSAIQLCRDICYNLRQVWGSCDPVTLEMTKLLSALFTASNNHKSAAALHEGALHELMADSNAKNHPHAADTASQHMELLRRSQSRLGAGKSDSSRSPNHADLITQVTNRFGLKDNQIQGVGEANGGDQFGVWSRPRRFSIDVDDLDEQGPSHHNHLRESSGGHMGHGNGTGRRISVQAL